MKTLQEQTEQNATTKALSALMKEAMKPTPLSYDSPMPFGKHKGSSMLEVLRDGDYVLWATSQPDIERKWPAVVAFFRAGGAPTHEQDCSPEHNAVQLRFLDPHIVGQVGSYMMQRYDFYLPRPGRITYGKNKGKTYCDVWVNSPRNDQEMPCDLEWACTPAFGKARFEVSGWDVVFTVGWKAECPDHGEQHCGDMAKVMVELKPTIGDDYMAVLRQVEQRREVGRVGPGVCLVLCDHFDSRVAEFSQVVEIYRRSNMVLARWEDIVAHDYDSEAITYV